MNAATKRSASRDMQQYGSKMIQTNEKCFNMVCVVRLLIDSGCGFLQQWCCNQYGLLLQMWLRNFSRLWISFGLVNARRKISSYEPTNVNVKCAVRKSALCWVRPRNLIWHSAIEHLRWLKWRIPPQEFPFTTLIKFTDCKAPFDH